MISQAVHQGEDHRSKSSYSEQDQHEERHRNPLIAQGPRPVEARLEEAARRLPHQHERAGQAEEVSRRQQHQHQHAAKVQPTEGGGKILRRQAGSEQSMQDHHHADDEQWQLEQRTGITPAKQAPQARDSH